jgi:iron complex outermembrane receptor protein
MAQAQNIFRATITNKNNTPLAGATVTWKEGRRSFISDSNGLVITGLIPDGAQRFFITHVGYEEKAVSLRFPISADSIFLVVMEQAQDDTEEQEVIVSATRMSRSIGNNPTRVEVISGEELSEKGNMKPGEIRMLLTESTGIQTQQTSATSYNSSIRIQGLDGRYTQILKDGFPLYAGFSGGLSIMQVTPLDLSQVEVIKGSSSTLYGGGAIAGLVNLVSRTPGEKRALNFVSNVTSARGLDLSGFYSERYGKAGITVFASRNSNGAFDPAGLGLTAIPEFERYTINPRLFLYGKKLTADMGASYITEDRIGGNVKYIRNGGSGYFEENATDRFTAQLGAAYKLNEGSFLNIKNSYNRFNRQIRIPDYLFKGLQQSTFSEITWNLKKEKLQWIAGANFLTDDFREETQSTDPARDYHFNTYGLFVQNVYALNERFTLETGLRGDYVNQYGFALLPRVSALFRINPKLSTRIGGGLGYKTPTVFNEDAERVHFRHVLPVSLSATQNERSNGYSWDINYRTTIADIGVSLNHLFFYTRLNQPLVPVTDAAGNISLQNANGHIDTKGMETNLRLVYGDFKLFIGYTFADVETHYNNKKAWTPLSSRHRLNNVLMYEKDEKIKLGLEAYYFSPQKLGDETMGRAYVIMGFMAERMWERFSIFINFENFTDTRQTRFDTIFTGSVDNPVFRDIYAPVDGFVMNGGIKLRL